MTAYITQEAVSKEGSLFLYYGWVDYIIIKVEIIDTNEIKYFCFDITGFFGKFQFY